MNGPTGRLAPSPTGGLHVGHARTFLVAWLAAKSKGGRMVLRIEDIDGSRVRPGASEGAIDDLRWLGLAWDEGPFVQSERMGAYRDALELLKRQGLVYPCTCTRADIERAASAPHPGEETLRYPGTCAGRSASEGDELERSGRPFAWRFRVGAGSIGWDDLFLGRIDLDPSLAGDFIVARSPFAPSYQLAVVVDDAAMGIDQVIRGDDLVPSTPRQILLYRALGRELPGFGHVPLVIGADGRRLAKRDGSIKLSTLREGGMNSEWLIGCLAHSCGWAGEVEPCRPADLVTRFRPETIPRHPWSLSTPAWAGPATG